MLTLAAATVLIELFTSEGCSSCPPADAVLTRLHETQPVTGVKLLVLAEHVDYWNDLGWKDPFSDRLFTERQSRYGDRMYTPQAVVDGRIDVLGSDAAGIARAAAAAASDPHGGVTCRVSPQKKIFFSVTGLPPHGPAQVLLATVEDGLVSKVLRGENEGRTLPHTAVVRSLKGIGHLAAGETAWSGEVDPPQTPRTRLVLFVQDRESMRVLAAGSQ